MVVKPEDAFGRYDDNFIIEKPKKMMDENIYPKVGMKLVFVDKKGEMLPAFVKEVKDKSIRLDANHPLAGKTLVFDITIVDIV